MEEKFQINESDFKFAFTIQNHSDHKRRDDPRYVKMYARLRRKVNGEQQDKTIGHHICTDEELDQFYEPTISSKAEYDDMREDPDRVLYCLDWDNEEMYLVGDRTAALEQHIEILFTACNFLLDETDSIHPDCIAD